MEQRNTKHALKYAPLIFSKNPLKGQAGFSCKRVAHQQMILRLSGWTVAFLLPHFLQADLGTSGGCAASSIPSGAVSIPHEESSIAVLQRIVQRFQHKPKDESNMMKHVLFGGDMQTFMSKLAKSPYIHGVLMLFPCLPYQQIGGMKTHQLNRNGNSSQ